MNALFNKALFVPALGGVLAVALVGCSASSTSNTSAGSFTQSATPTPSAEPVSAQPFNSGGYLGGNANPTLPAGDSGKVSVVAQGPLTTGGIGGTLLFAFRNNTSEPISHVDFTGTASAGGKLAASGNSQGTIPAQIQPGEAGLAFIYFDDSSSIPATGATYDFKASTSPADTSSYNTAPLTVDQSANNGTSIIGSAVNKTGKPLVGPYSVSIFCFEGDTLTKHVTDFASESGDITADASVSFSTNLYDSPCETYAVGVSGYFK